MFPEELHGLTYLGAADLRVDFFTRKLSDTRRWFGSSFPPAVFRVPLSMFSPSANLRRLRTGFGGGLSGTAGRGAYFSRCVGSLALPKPRYCAIAGL
jgi:hypothetical protein